MAGEGGVSSQLHEGVQQRGRFEPSPGNDVESRGGEEEGDGKVDSSGVDGMAGCLLATGRLRAELEIEC